MELVVKQIYKAILLLAIYLTSCISYGSETADIILSNGKIWTGDKSNPYATTLAIKGNKIIAVGSNAVEKLKGKSTNVINLKGKRVTPL